MKKICYVAFLVLLGCGQQKAVESIAADTVQRDTAVTAGLDVAEPLTSSDAADDSEPPLIKLEPGHITELERIIYNNPFILEDMNARKMLLDSLGVTSDYNYSENGSLSYDSSEIVFNLSYGESICSADIRSNHLGLKNGIAVGISLEDFSAVLGIKASADENVRYEYTTASAESNYKMQFDFVNRVLTRFYYSKDPCVIYD